MLSTTPIEANLFRAVRAMVPTVKAVRVPAPFTCYVSIEQRISGQGKNAILAVLGADLYMKRVVVVDHDVDIFNDRQSTGRLRPDANRIATSRSFQMRAALISIPQPRKTATPQVGSRCHSQTFARRVHSAPPGPKRSLATHQHQ